MKAGHMVIAIEDTSFVVSSSISLTSYEPQTTPLLSNLTDQPLINLNYNNELFLVSNSQLETITQPTEELSSINSFTCYNKFLLYHKLPLLEHPQTILTFLQYIKHDFSFYYLLDFIKISILNNKDHNNNYTKAHIYLLHKLFLLSNHFIPPFSSLL